MPEKLETNVPAPLREGAETFEFKLPSGEVIVGGKPRGVLKLKLRNILTEDLIKDPEMVTMATAFLSIVSVDGQPLWLRTANEFEAFMDRFGSDENLNEFMNAFNHVANPEMANAIDAALDEAFDANMKPKELEDHVTQRLMTVQAQSRKKVRD